MQIKMSCFIFLYHRRDNVNPHAVSWKVLKQLFDWLSVKQVVVHIFSMFCSYLKMVLLEGIFLDVKEQFILPVVIKCFDQGWRVGICIQAKYLFLNTIEWESSDYVLDWQMNYFSACTACAWLSNTSEHEGEIINNSFLGFYQNVCISFLTCCNKAEP